MQIISSITTMSNVSNISNFFNNISLFRWTSNICWPERRLTNKIFDFIKCQYGIINLVNHRIFDDKAPFFRYSMNVRVFLKRIQKMQVKSDSTTNFIGTVRIRNQSFHPYVVVSLWKWRDNKFAIGATSEVHHRWLQRWLWWRVLVTICVCVSWWGEASYLTPPCCKSSR
jgi:hypothetical protein